ncbi:ThiF family adenylyltransferase [Candidatus Allofournierella merdipullorum]|uniref:tRNA threonylcarbamoyladenosine dehydratase n=1 Tax=Candidatus Allofournierella merdipullorum TaxID=2838595 RepID=UPI003AB753D0
MSTAFESRTAMLLGEAGVEKLRRAHVVLFGLGGVGGYVAEALARAGVGALTLVDDDRVAESNLNRQIIALTSNVGCLKTEAAAARVRAINPACKVVEKAVFYTPETADQVPLDGADYVVDAVDTVTAKLEIIARARAAGVPVISCMGTGNKLHPELLRLSVLEKTEGCPLARVMRRECRARGLKNVPVVYSPEPPRALAAGPAEEGPGPERSGAPRRQTPGSVSFVPGAAGLILAGKVIRDIAGAE